MLYRLQEGALELEGDWQDQSIQVLAPLEAARGVNLVAARDILPMGMTLNDYIAQQRTSFHRQMQGLKISMDQAGALDGRDAHFMEIAWSSEGRQLHQLVATVLHEKNALLTFTASMPDAVDAETRRGLMRAISSFKFNPPSAPAA